MQLSTQAVRGGLLLQDHVDGSILLAHAVHDVPAVVDCVVIIRAAEGRHAEDQQR